MAGAVWRWLLFLPHAKGMLADVGIPLHFSGLLNSSLHAKFFVLRPPPELRQLRGRALECEYFGHMYSFEYMYTDFFEMNRQFLANSAEEADFVVLEHCVTYAYHVLRYGAGFNTVKLTWEALRIAQESYLLPLIHWAETTPAYQKTQGRNFVIVFAMDKGLEMARLKLRHALGSGRNQPWLRPESDSAPDPCKGRSSTSKRRLVYYEQDVVVPVPTSFEWTPEAQQTEDRHLLVFYAASPNSCIRRSIASQLAASDDAEVLVIPKPIPKKPWSDFLFRSKFCFVPDGFSSISARLYEVLLHGCVPVLLTHAFHPLAAKLALLTPSESVASMPALVLEQVADAPAILRNISEEEYLSMHRQVTRVQRMFMPLGLQCRHAFLDSYEHGVDAAQARPRLNSAGEAGDGAGTLFHSCTDSEAVCASWSLKRKFLVLVGHVQLLAASHATECKERAVEALVGRQRVSARDVAWPWDLAEIVAVQPPGLLMPSRRTALSSQSFGAELGVRHFMAAGCQDAGPQPMSRKTFASQPLRPAPPGAEGGHFVAPRRQQNLDCVKPPLTYEAISAAASPQHRLPPPQEPALCWCLTYTLDFFMTSGISVIDGSIQAAALAVADVSASIAAIAAPTGSRLVAGVLLRLLGSTTLALAALGLSAPGMVGAVAGPCCLVLVCAREIFWFGWSYKVDAIFSLILFAGVAGLRFAASSVSTSEALAPETPVFESWDQMPTVPTLFDVRPVGPPLLVSFGCYISLSVQAIFTR
ncbi:unnamed protein product [Symbiodinium sp. CCMP2592]|nr:unnamed protein product [Symbiodinium sp. CCMP2592]